MSSTASASAAAMTGTLAKSGRRPAGQAAPASPRRSPMCPAVVSITANTGRKHPTSHTGPSQSRPPHIDSITPSDEEIPECAPEPPFCAEVCLTPVNMLATQIRVFWRPSRIVST